MNTGLTMEMQMLVWTVVLGLVQVMLQAASATSQRGLKWNAGPRDGTPAALTGVAARLDRALHNFLETFPFFAVAVLAVAATGRANADTALGAQIYFWSRVAYVPLYAAGVPYLRSLAWGAALVGLLMVLKPLF